jgi:phosphoglycerate dehydrogenase-like enzyme
MTALKIFADSPLDESNSQALQKGARPHEILFPKLRASSVLAKPMQDPSFALADVAFGQPDLESIRNSDRLKWLHLSTAGFTRYDTPEFRALAADRGLIVTNSSAVYAAACAEHVFTFMMAQSRQLPSALTSHTANGTAEWFELREHSKSLRGQHVVILGFGEIAKELVKLLAPFEMEITAMRRTPRGDEGVLTVTGVTLANALATADHVINILPDNAASQNFINAERIAQMKRGVVFHNIGRGTTVDQEALLVALRSHQVAAAWLDVTDPEPLTEAHPLRHEPNCHITPHIAGGHFNESGTLVQHFLKNLRLYHNNQPLCNRIM